MIIKKISSNDFNSFLALVDRAKKRIYHNQTLYNVMFLGVLFRFMKSKLHYCALESQFGGFYFKKYRKFETFFFILFFSNG